MYSTVELKEPGWWWLLLFRCQDFNYSDGGTCWESQLILPCFSQTKTPCGGEESHEVSGSAGAAHMQLHNLHLPPTATQARHLLISELSACGCCGSQKALQYGARCIGVQSKPNLSGKISQPLELRRYIYKGKILFWWILWAQELHQSDMTTSRLKALCCLFCEDTRHDKINNISK